MKPQNFLKYLFRSDVNTSAFILLFAISGGVPLYDYVRMGVFDPISLIYSGIFLVFIIVNFLQWKRLK